MRACHHWYKLEHAQWGSATPLAPRGVLLARLHHVRDASVAWGTLVKPPVVTPDWGTNDRAAWDTWALDAIPAIHRFMILSGVAHVQGTFCTHPMGNETRLPCGPSLGGALRPGGANTIIDGLLLYDDTSTHERWNCSDADLRRHMANEIMRLSSDKTVPSTTTAYTTYPFTKAAKDVLFDVHSGDPPPTPHGIGEPTLGKDVGPTPRDPPHIPPPPDVARARGSTKAALLDALHLAIESVMHLPWSTIDTWDKLRPIAQQAQHLGFLVPPWVHAMADVTTMALLRYGLEEHARRYTDPTKCDFTHILQKHSSTALDPLFPGLPRADVRNRLKAQWHEWSAPIAAQSSSISTHLKKSSGTLSDALQPPLDPGGVIARAFSDCLCNYSDVDDLHKALMLMPSTSTGGMMGVTREHLSHAPREIKEWIIELTGDIFVGLSPSILKLGVVAPLPKDSKRFRPVTLLEPITKLVTGTVARRLSLLLHKHSLLHPHQFGFVQGGSCEAPIEVVNDMYEHACEHDEELHVAFLDATSAFDTVQHPALTAAFAAIGAAPSFVRWIKFIVTGHRRVIRTAYSMGDQASEFALESGTPQGDPLSPLLWATVVDFALRHAHTSGAPGFQIGRRTPCQLLCYADDIALFAHSHAHLTQTTQAIATALAAVGVRLNAAKSYYTTSPAAGVVQPITFVALDADGVLREQTMTTVPPTDAVRYLGVWFSFTGPASDPNGRWAVQMQKLEATVRSFFGKCSSLRPSFAQMCEVIEGTLIRRLLFPIQGGIPVWPLLDRVRGIVSQWIHRTLGLRGSSHGNDNVSDVMHAKRTHGGLGVPDVTNIYIECMTSTWLAGAHSHVPVVRAAYMSRISAQADAAIAVSLSRSITEQHTASLNRLFSIFCMGIRIHKGCAPLLTWCRTAPAPVRREPDGPEAAWQEQIATHLVPLPGMHIYPPSTAGQYDLRLRSQLMLPPVGTVFLLIPAAPLTPDDPGRTRDIPLHRLVTSLQLLSHAYVGFVSLPEAIFHANHTIRYPASVRAVRMDSQSIRFCDLSTVGSCSLHEIDGHSSACRHAVSLGLVVYYPYGRLGTLPFLPPPDELSTEDILVPTPGWLPPDPPVPGSPAKDAHALARDWTESLLMTGQLIAHASRWMMTFHDSFLNKLEAVSTLRLVRPDRLFLAHQTRTTHKPRFARRRPRHGVAFTTAAQALRHAIRQTDVQYIYMLPTAQCKVVDTSAPRILLSLACAQALAAGAVLIDIASLPTEHGMSHVPPLCVSPMRPLALDDADPLRVHVLVDGSPLSIHTVCDTAEWMGQAVQTHSAGTAPPPSSGL